MDIKVNKENGKLVLQVEGRIDTVTAPDLFETVNSNLQDVNELVFDLKMVDYVSSAGLRVFLSCQKIMNKQGKMIVKNVDQRVMEVFELTGFDEVLTIE